MLLAAALCTALGFPTALIAAAAAETKPAKAQSRAKKPRPAPAVPSTAWPDPAVLDRFAAEVGKRRGLPDEWIATQLAQSRRIESIRRLIMPPATPTAKNWGAYRARFVEPARIAAGVEFWGRHRDALDRAERRWGVPAAIVVGIIGVETYYGRITGGFRTIDVLATLAFDFPEGRSDRSAFFLEQLEEFFVMCAREGLDPQSVKGSYAGAIGLPQFMPGSVNRHAVDHDGDGHVDLMASADDAIGSVAAYLAAYGWQPGVPAVFDVTPPPPGAGRDVLLVPDIVPTFVAADFAERSAVLSPEGRGYGGALALVELHNGGAEPSFVAGTQNFYTITRYNQSSYYALAVVELARAVAASAASR